MKNKSLINILDYLAYLTWRSKFYRYCLFGLATIFTIFFSGYHFGSFDQAVHIPFLKKYADPTLYPNDSFLDLRHYHYSFFWFFFIPFYKLGFLEISIFISYVVVIFLTFWALWKLSKTLFDNPLVSFLTVLVFIFPHFVFSGFTVFEFSLLNRIFVLPFLLFAIDLYLRKRYLQAFIILGIMYNFHVISVNFVLAMVFFDSLLKLKTIGSKTFLINLSAFLVFALPVLIWKMNTTPVQLSANWEWFSIVSNGMLYHIYYFLGNNPILLLTTLGGISSIVLFYLAKKRLSKNEYNSTVTNFIIADCIILFFALITTYFYPAVIIIESQIIRAGLYILIFSYLYFIGCAVNLFRAKSLKKQYFYLLLVALIFSISPLTLILVWFIYKFLPSKTALIISGLSISLIFIFLIFLTLKLDIWEPGINITPKNSPLYAVEIWAKNNTSKDAIFLTPPHLWWFYTPDWRAISERSTVVTLYDLIEIVFAPNYLPFWKERFQSVMNTPNILGQYNGNVFKNMQITKIAFYNQSKEHFIEQSKKYNASFMLVEKPYTYDFPIIYENEGFILYDLVNFLN